MSKVNINDILKEYFNEDIIQEGNNGSNADTQGKNDYPGSNIQAIKQAEPQEKKAQTTPAPDASPESKSTDEAKPPSTQNNNSDANTELNNYKAIMTNYQLYCRTYIQSIRTVSDFIYYDYKKIIDQLNDNLAQQGKPAPQQQNQDNNQGEQQPQTPQQSAGEFNLDDYAGEMTAFDEMLADESVIGDVKNTAKDWLNSGESLVKYSKRKIKNKIDNALSDDDDKKKDDKSSVADKTKAIFRKHGVGV